MNRRTGHICKIEPEFSGTHFAQRVPEQFSLGIAVQVAARSLAAAH